MVVIAAIGVRFAVAVTVGVAVLLFAARAGATLAPTVADVAGFERVTLADLGFESRDVLPNLASPIVEFDLPPGAAQGPRSWLKGYLHFAIRFAPDSSGLAYLSADTDGATMAQIKFELKPGRGMRYSTLALPEGRREHAVQANAAEVRFSNYLQTAGVRAGRNTLSVTLELAEAVRVEELVLYDDSAIERTEVSPYPLVVDLSGEARRTIRAGERFKVTYTVRVDGDAVAEDVVVSAVPTGPLAVVGVDKQRIPGTVGRVPQRGSFTLRARRPGEYSVELRVRSSLNRPVRTIGIRVLPRGTTRRWVPYLLIPLSALAAGGVLVRHSAGGRGRSRTPTLKRR